MFTLYHNNMSSCSQKVRFVLAAKGLAWESVELNLREGEQHGPDYLKLNPNGVVPTLVVDGVPIIESALICEYLDELVTEPALMPAAPLTRALIRNWMRHIDDHIHAQAGVVSYALAFRHTLLQRGEEAAREKLMAIPDEAKRARMLSVTFEGTLSPCFGASVTMFRRMLQQMQALLGDRPYLFGDAMSLGDVVTLPYLVRLDHLGLSGLWRDLPAPGAWFDRMKGAPAFATAYTRWFDSDVVAAMGAGGAEAWPGVERQVFATAPAFR